MIYKNNNELFTPQKSFIGMEGGRKETVLSSVQEMWEKSFREIGEDNPEHTVTGIIIFYPTYLIAYCEVRFSELFKSVKRLFF